MQKLSMNKIIFASLVFIVGPAFAGVGENMAYKPQVNFDGVMARSTAVSAVRPDANSMPEAAIPSALQEKISMGIKTPAVSAKPAPDVTRDELNTIATIGGILGAGVLLAAGVTFATGGAGVALAVVIAGALLALLIVAHFGRHFDSI